MADPNVDMPEEFAVLAGLYSLRVLEGEDLANAQRAMLTDPEFVAAVEWWDLRFGLMAEEGIPLVPSDDVRKAVLARVRLEKTADGLEPMPDRTTKASMWSIGLATFGTAMAAAALVLYVAAPAGTKPVSGPAAVSQGSQLIAQLQNDDGTIRLAALVQTETRQLVVNTSGLQPESGQTAELWVIPDGGAPRSLGYIPAGGSLDRELTAAEAELIVQGSAMAVTYEEDTGLPHDAPSPPILLVGAVDTV